EVAAGVLDAQAAKATALATTSATAMKRVPRPNWACNRSWGIRGHLRERKLKTLDRISTTNSVCDREVALP
ncbi:MAG: hypothetical protein MP439_09405, partial [Ferrimicrobium sp.]|nr:hypothetical protein [Ferrimicrobium sp.]